MKTQIPSYRGKYIPCRRLFLDNRDCYRPVNLFLDLEPTSFNKMTEACAVGDFEKVQKIAHRIKPSLDNMGIVSIRDNMRDIEKKAAVCQTSAQLESLLNKVSTVITRVVNDLKQRSE